MTEPLQRYERLGTSAYAMQMMCLCGANWGRHSGVHCPGNKTLFVPCGEPVSMTPTLDKLEAESQDFDDGGPYNGLEGVLPIKTIKIRKPASYTMRAPVVDPNARMIASDDTEAARVYAYERKFIREVFDILQAAPINNAKAPIPGLTRMSAQDHRLGMGIR